MNLQQYRFKFLTTSKNFAIAILFAGSLFSLHQIVDFSKARRISAMNAPEFRQYVDNYKPAGASLRSLQAVAKKALEISPQELESSQKATKEILKKKPTCLDCHNRIVFFDLTENDKLTESGLSALRSSYELSPYGKAEIMKWRLELSSNFWDDLDEDLQKSSLTQITALSQFQAGQDWLRKFKTDVNSIKTRVTRLTN